MDKLAQLIFRFDSFEFDLQILELRHAGIVLKIDLLVARLLAQLLEAAGELVTKQELFARLWRGRAVSENALTVAMTRLRRTLSQNCAGTVFISTVSGRGYRFVRPVSCRNRKLAGAEHVAADRCMRLIGREPVMKMMRGVLDDVASGFGRACIISGEAGIGKTRTAEEIAREGVSLGLSVIWSYCRGRDTTPPLWPFAQLIRGALAKGYLGHENELVTRWLCELSHLLPELEDHAATGRVAANTSLTAQHRLFDAITQLLLTAATTRPLLLVLDDIDQADAATVDLLRYLVDEVAQAPLLVLATMRTPLASSARPGASTGICQLLAHRSCREVQLERLSEQAISEWVAVTLRERREHLAHAVFIKSEGHPFIVRELLHQAELNPSVNVEALAPSTATLELARQRLSSLDEHTIEMLSCAAVIGRHVELALLHLVAQMEMDVLLVRLDAARACKVLDCAPETHTAFSFDLEMLREALYARMTSTHRRTLHRRIADALVALAQAGASVSARSLAHHLHAALPECDLRGCVQWCMAAAEEAGQAFAYPERARHLSHAREALDLIRDGDLRLRRRLLQGQPLAVSVTCGEQTSAGTEPSTRGAT